MNILITGATRGIGKACTELFLEKGYKVIATYEKNGENPELVIYKKR